MKIATSTRGRRFLYGLRASLLLAVVGLSFAPENVKSFLHTHGDYHLYGHSLAFCIAALLLISGVRIIQRALMLSAAVILCGCAIEVAQKFIYINPLETLDMWADCLGVTLGFALWLFWHETYPFIKPAMKKGYAL
jgi:hypothetical protein